MPKTEPEPTKKILGTDPGLFWFLVILGSLPWIGLIYICVAY